MKKIRMYRQEIVFLVIVQYCLTIGYASDEAGCSHNGTMFADGSLVPSVEPCLNCKCLDSHLICSLRVCSEQPIPPPRGCILVHRKLSCCPHLSCKKYHIENENHIPNRKVITYNSHWYNDNDAINLNGGVNDQRKVISKNSLYRRIDDEEIHGNKQMCVHNGTIYRTGSAMSTSTLCSYCYCIGGKEKCVKPKCLIASPGCEPVFIDSACCPIRYDCGIVGTDFDTLNVKNRFQRIGNKHYNRMRSRAQRRCSVGSNYYAEGEKLPIDASKPCDICFCIRGARKCTPKKCAPFIGNCKPKIPEGQCCPASYECDHSVDDWPPRFNHTSRQFNLFNYFFGDETEGNETSKEPDQVYEPYPSLPESSVSISSTSEKSFFDAIREGLNYIDSNDEHVEKILDNSGGNATISERPLSANNSELSFLDILLGDENEDEDERPSLYNEGTISLSNIKNSSDIDETSTIFLRDSSAVELDHDQYAVLNQHSTDYEFTTAATYLGDSIKFYDSTIRTKTSSYDRDAAEKLINQLSTSVPVYDFESSTRSTVEDFVGTTFTESSTPEHFSFSAEEYGNTISEQNGAGWTTIYPTIHYDDVSSEVNLTVDSSTESNSNEGTTKTQTTISPKPNQTDDIIVTTQDNVALAFNGFSDENSAKQNYTLTMRPETRRTTITTTTQAPPEPFPELSTIIQPLYSTPLTTTTQAPPITNTTRRINPTTISTPIYPSSFRPPSLSHVASSSTLSQPIQTTTEENAYNANTKKQHLTTSKIALTTTMQPNQPSLINSNPSILESDLNYDYGDQPTLPPSLPNLKIIPFLPTDAVQKDNNVKSKFDYYPNDPTSYPVLTENYDKSFKTIENQPNQNSDFEIFEGDDTGAIFEDSFNRHNENSDFNSYSIESTGYSNEPIFGIPNTNEKSSDYDGYPSITENYSQSNGQKTILNKYPTYNKYDVEYDYDAFDTDKHLDTVKYITGSHEVLDGHEYSAQGQNPAYNTFVTEYPERHKYSKIEFTTSNPLFGFNGNNKFSPPSKTEGGFLPKEPLQNDQYYNNFHNTKYHVDITTEASPKSNLTGLLIGITSEDPFKNVIRTELPPNLLTLIEDKDKLFQKNPEVSITNIDHDYPSIHLSDLEKEIISITTDSNYNVEYANEPYDFTINNETIATRHATYFDDDILSNTTAKYSTEINVSSNSRPKPTTAPETNDFLGSLFGYIFKDNHNIAGTQSATSTQAYEKSTIPPFKKISSTALTLLDILNFTKPIDSSSKKTDIPQRKNNKIYEYPTTSPLPQNETQTSKVENLNILRDVLLATLNSPSSIDPSKHIDTHPTIDIPKPIYSTHSIHQFLNPIFSGNSEFSQVTHQYTPIRSEIDLTIPKLNSQIGDNKDELINNLFGPESYQVLNDYPSISNKPFGENPIDYDTLKEHHSDENSPNIFAKPLNSFQNPMGFLKLAGCNIYGRMYRVGRVITELSNPCLECKCTEVGVHCTPLNC